MSFIKLLKVSSKLFKKEVITFLIIRRHDLGILEEKLCYIAVKPTASISKLRQKIWYLLDLPDYCEEIIILKSNDEKEIPLTALCEGNDPQHPYILEVWLPNNLMLISTINNNMLTMGDKELLSDSNRSSTYNMSEDKGQGNKKSFDDSKKNDENTGLIKSGILENNKLSQTDKRSELSYRISNTSLLFKMTGRKTTDNFACILLKMQNDLSTLSNKLSELETKINF